MTYKLKIGDLALMTNASNPFKVKITDILKNRSARCFLLEDWKTKDYLFAKKGKIVKFSTWTLVKI